MIKKLKTAFMNNPSSNKIKKIDVFIIGIIILIYSFFALYKLGTFTNPESFKRYDYVGDTSILKITDNRVYGDGIVPISKIRLFVGPNEGKYKLYASLDRISWQELTEFKTEMTFSWEEFIVNSGTFNFCKGCKPGDFVNWYIKIESLDADTYIGEVQFFDTYGEVLNLINISGSDVLIDERDKIPVDIGYLNSMYFDEIYFSTSAYQYVHNIHVMEWTHPPLGKLIIAISVSIFGMSTFSYRILGVIAGILMIPVFYILAKKLFKNTKYATLAGIIMAADNFHLAQSRMGTVDTFLVLFMLLSVLFMKMYIDLDKNDKFRKKMRYLLFSGIFIGCAIATKWTGLYVGLGLAIILCYDILTKYEIFKPDLSRKGVVKILGIISLFFILIPFLLYQMGSLMNLNGIIFILVYIFVLLIDFSIKIIRKDKSFIKILVTCIISFILIPICIYILSYVLFPNLDLYNENSIRGIIDIQKEMYNYHAYLTETHPFQSKWWSWPVMYKPVWLHIKEYGPNLKSTIVGIGNPLIWWFGVFTTVFTLVRMFFKTKKEELLILLFILCTYIPYMFIDRPMFMYHFFPTLPFVMLTIVSFMKYICEKFEINIHIVLYIILILITFIVFYPITSGITVSTDYVDSLKWLSSWVF